MADISTPAAVLASGTSYSVAVGIGIPESLALPVAIAAAGGASWAMSNRERVTSWTVLGVLAALSAWVFSWLFGVLFGHIAVDVIFWLLPADAKTALPRGAIQVACALVLSGVGISHILPWALKQLPVRTTNTGDQ